MLIYSTDCSTTLDKVMEPTGNCDTYSVTSPAPAAEHIYLWAPEGANADVLEQ